MGTIVERRRKDGNVRYTAQIRKKKGSKTVSSRSQTFSTRKMAEAWIKKQEKAAASGLPVVGSPRDVATLGDVIARYLDDAGAKMGKTKMNCLKIIRDSALGEKPCSSLDSTALLDFARDLRSRVAPSTVNNYLQHLSAVFDVAEVAYQADLKYADIHEAKRIARHLGLISKSNSRDRRPTLDEIDRLVAHFHHTCKIHDAMPMHKIIAFAISSSRREGEITRLLWKDLNEEKQTIRVRDMKHPGQKRGNDVWVRLPDDALAIIKSMPRVCDEIFPYAADSIGDAFRDACKLLGIVDLHFHDLRHEAVSVLFEKGASIAEARRVSGHRCLSSLQRYEHFETAGDKYAGWDGWRVATEPEPQSRIDTVLRRKRLREARR